MKDSDFAKEKILEASKIDDVSIEISDRTEVNIAIAEKLKPKKFQLQRLLPLAASIVVFLAIALMLPYFLKDDIEGDGTSDDSTYSASITLAELNNQINGIQYPDLSGYSATSVLLFKQTDNHKAIYAEIILMGSQSNSIVLTVLFETDRSIPDEEDYLNLPNSEIIDGITVKYKISYEEKHAFVKYKISQYSYYIYFKAENPEEIFEIL